MFSPNAMAAMMAAQSERDSAIASDMMSADPFIPDISGRSFLLELPAELRLRIYDFTFDARTVPLFLSEDILHYVRTWAFPSTRGLRTRCTALLATCKLIHREARPVLFDTTTFRVKRGPLSHAGETSRRHVPFEHLLLCVDFQLEERSYGDYLGPRLREYSLLQNLLEKVDSAGVNHERTRINFNVILLEDEHKRTRGADLRLVKAMCDPILYDARRRNMVARGALWGRIFGVEIKERLREQLPGVSSDLAMQHSLEAVLLSRIQSDSSYYSRRTGRCDVVRAEVQKATEAERTRREHAREQYRRSKAFKGQGAGAT